MNDALAMLRRWRCDHWLLTVLIGLVLFFVYDGGNWHTNAASLMGSNSALPMQLLKVAVLTLVTVIGYSAVAAALLSRCWPLFLVGLAIYLGGIVNRFIMDLSGSFPDATLFAVGMQEHAMAMNFFSSNWKLVLMTGGYSSALLAAILVLRSKCVPNWSRSTAGESQERETGKRLVYVVGSLLVVAIVANGLLATSTDGRRPAAYGYNAIGEYLKALLMPQIPYVQRATAPPVTCSSCPSILFFAIDESITHEALVASGSTLPHGTAIGNQWGVPAAYFSAYAAGNHSSISNYILRLGVGKSAYPDIGYRTLSLPNIFSYAKAAGYETIFYDAQKESKRLQNLMSQYDLKAVDRFLVADTSSDRFNRDMEALDRLRDYIEAAGNERRLAIVLVKNGVHFPYVNSVPASRLSELPEGCRSADTSFSAQDAFCKKAQYEAAIRFAVDEFMGRLFSMLADKDFALVYTSDHGQSISSKYRLPHGSVENTSACEISVPIFIAGKVFADGVQPEGVRSHFQIPPTILRILGQQDRGDMRDPTLWEEWRGGDDFLYEPFAQASEWRRPAGPCVY
jgi:hypothetical protein